MQNTFNLTSVVVTHDLESVRIIADRVCLLNEGKIVAIGELKNWKQTTTHISDNFLHGPQM
jgi:ABC-type transporter Mla maintaining outer membrane lipid asymmetry ATPase subunit MlaF